VTHYDLVLIGTGSGNSVVDRRFKDWKVAIVEENLFGGTCLNVGCIPTKMFVYPADVAHETRHGSQLGLRTSYDGASWPAIRDRIFGRIDPIEQSGRHYRQSLENIDLYESHCTFADDHTLHIHGAEEREIRAGDCVVLAPGTEHKLWNTGDEPLVLLCCCAPAYSHEDTVLTGG